MKWTATTILILLAATSSTALLWPVAGGGTSSYNPFYPFYYGFNNLGGGGVGCLTPPSLNITYPVQNDTFYLPNITPNVTFNLSASTDPFCYYRLFIEGTAYAWNAWSGCGEGSGEVNHKLITLPQGQPVTIQVRVDDGNCRVYDMVNVNVYYQTGNKQTDTVYLLGIMLMLAFFWKIRRRRAWVSDE
jgi:LPXTG-motif cell wall-anchored protein